jgi:hypothetical protein
MPARKTKSRSGSVARRPARRQTSGPPPLEKEPFSVFPVDPAIPRAAEQFHWAYQKAEQAGLNLGDLLEGLFPWDVIRRMRGLSPDADLWLGMRPHHKQKASAARARFTRDLLNRLPRSRALREFLLARLIELSDVPDDLKRLTRMVLGVDRAGRAGKDKAAKPNWAGLAIGYAVQFPQASLREIAAAVGVAPSTVALMFKRRGFKHKAGGFLPGSAR